MYLTKALIVSLTILAATAARAEYPDRPITLIQPFGTGGVAWAIASVFAKSMSKSLGQPVVVESRSRGGPVTGTTSCARGEPDGYRICFAGTANLVLALKLPQNRPYESLSDFEFLGFFSEAGPPVVIVKGDSNGDWRALEQEAKTGAVNGASNNRTLTSLAGMELLNLAGLGTVPLVPYASDQEAVTAVLGGHVRFAVVLASTALAALQNGTVKALVQLGEKHNAFLPDVPTPAELGINGFSGYRVANALVTQKNTPLDALNKLSLAIKRGGRDPEVIEKFRTLGVATLYGTPKEVQEWVTKTTVRWERLVKEYNLPQD